MGRKTLNKQTIDRVSAEQSLNQSISKGVKSLKKFMEKNPDAVLAGVLLGNITIHGKNFNIFLNIKEGNLISNQDDNTNLFINR